MNPPKCRNCGKAEWSHLCRGQVVLKQALTRIISTKGKKVRVVEMKARRSRAPKGEVAGE